MRPLIDILAILGFLAVAWRAVRALARALGRTAERVVAGQALEARAQRGDLTGMAEAGAWRREASRRRWRTLLRCALWVALLVVPTFTAWTRPTYAAYAALWVWQAFAR